MDVFKVHKVFANELWINDGRANFLYANWVGSDFGLSVGQRVASNAIAAAAADVDGDGDYDLVVGNELQNELYVVENCPGAVRVGSADVCITLPGFARRSSVSDVAAECFSHYRRTTESGVNDKCETCPTGMARLMGSDVCTACPAGDFQESPGQPCQNCEAGTCVAGSRSLDL